MKLNKREFNLWVKHLYAETYPKGRLSLETEDHKFCCLGVACKVLIPLKLQETKTGENKLRGGYPRNQFNAPEWLKKINDDFYRITEKTLSKLNDRDDFTHPEIAMLLELVYKYKAFN